LVLATQIKETYFVALGRIRRMELSNIESQKFEWISSYDASVSDEIDLYLLSQLSNINWSEVRRAADLACGTGRTGQWLKAKNIEQIDGLDITPEMLELAGRTKVYNRLVYGDMRTTLLGSSYYDLVTNVLADEHIPEIEPLYNEVSRILKPGGLYISVGFHPYFLLNGHSTHIDRITGVTIKNYVHLFSEHFRAASKNHFDLVEMNERVVDHEWISAHPAWEAHLDRPISYVLVWKKRTPLI
jgi:SAM-dependent methyltransferase